LAGPTNDVWIYPWTQYLAKLGVQFYPGTLVTADFYIAALPVEVIATLITDELKKAAPSLPTWTSCRPGG
jgi:hypothetical protein